MPIALMAVTVSASLSHAGAQMQTILATVIALPLFALQNGKLVAGGRSADADRMLLARESQS